MPSRALNVMHVTASLGGCWSSRWRSLTVIVSLLNDRPRCANLGDNAYQRVRRFFDLERYVRELERVYVDEL